MHIVFKYCSSIVLFKYITSSCDIQCDWGINYRNDSIVLCTLRGLSHFILQNNMSQHGAKHGFHIREFGKL